MNKVELVIGFKVIFISTVNPYDKLEIIYNNNYWTYCLPQSAWCPHQNLFSSFPFQSHSVCSLNKNCSIKNLTATNLLTLSSKSCKAKRLFIIVSIHGSVGFNILINILKYSYEFMFEWISKTCNRAVIFLFPSSHQ